jgi:uncharacterized membrane protein YukC
VNVPKIGAQKYFGTGFAIFLTPKFFFLNFTKFNKIFRDFPGSNIA